MFKWIKQIIAGVVASSAAVAIFAFIKERVQKDKTSHRPYGIYEKYLKRPLDAFLATGALIVLSPVLAITALLVRFKLGSPVLFTQDRPGKDEKIFKLYKFRTMTDARDENGELLPDAVRLTSFGKNLRSTSLDELPELINIIKGDMAIIGPRPLLVRYLPYYTDDERHRHDVRPGLTGMSQVHGRNHSSWQERFSYDLSYVSTISFLGDIKIIIDTVKAVLSHSGVVDRSQIHADENGDLYITIDGVKHRYPKPLDVERK